MCLFPHTIPLSLRVSTFHRRTFIFFSLALGLVVIHCPILVSLAGGLHDPPQPLFLLFSLPGKILLVIQLHTECRLLGKAFLYYLQSAGMVASVLSCIVFKFMTKPLSHATTCAGENLHDSLASWHLAVV